MSRPIKRNIKIKVIANPFAGSGLAHVSLPDIRKRLEAIFPRLDFSLTNGPGDATRLTREAVEDNFHRVVAVGGDGTVNEIANGLADSGVVLGVIPTGSCNNFFKMLSSDASLGNACRMIAEGDVTQVDTGVIGDELFINNVGVGVDALIADRCSRSKYSFLFGRSLILNIRSISAYDYPLLNLNLDSLALKGDFPLIAIGLGRYSGDGLKQIPYAVPSDGLFDVCVIKRRGKLRLLNHLLKAQNGLHVNNQDVALYRCSQIVLKSKDPFPFQVDGTRYESNPKGVTITINPKSLKVLRDRKNKPLG